MRRFGRLAVLVNPEKRKIEVESRIDKVVVVAAEERRLLLGAHHQTDVGVMLGPIKPVFAAAVKRDDVAFEAGRLAALALDRGDRGRAELCHFGVRLPFFAGSVDTVGDVLEGFEHGDVAVGYLQLVGRRFGVKAGLHQVAFLGREPGDVAGGDVVIGRDQAVRTDETGRRSADLRAGKPDIFKPLFRRLKFVTLLPLGKRRIVNRPHSLVGEDKLKRKTQQQEDSSYSFHTNTHF